MPATTPTGKVKTAHMSTARHFDSFLETVKSTDLEVYSVTRKRTVTGSLNQLKKKLQVYSPLAEALTTAWQNQLGFDGTEPEYQQFEDDRVSREDLASSLIEDLSFYEDCCDEEMQSQEAKQREKEALLREEAKEIRQEAAERETLLRKEAREQALVDKEDWVGLKALRGTQQPVEAPRVSNYKYQQLQLPKFQGDMLQFDYFWSCFQSHIDEDGGMNPSTKFQYLLSVVENPAQQLISGLAQDEEGYEKAKKILHKEFGDPYKIFRAHFHQFLELPKASVETLGEIFKAVDTHNQYLMSIDQDILDFRKEVILSIAMSKLPHGYYENFEERRTEDQWSMELLKEMVTKKVAAQITARVIGFASPASGQKPQSQQGHQQGHQQGYYSQQGQQSHQKPNQYKGSNFQPIRKSGYNALCLVNPTPRFQPYCAYCSGDHYPDDCKEFPDTTAQVNQLPPDACINCLGNTHPTAQCFRTKAYYYCKEAGHNSSLCQVKFGRLPNQYTQPGMIAPLISYGQNTQGNQQVKAFSSHGEPGSQRTHESECNVQPMLFNLAWAMEIPKKPEDQLEEGQSRPESRLTQEDKLKESQSGMEVPLTQEGPLSQQGQAKEPGQPQQQSQGQLKKSHEAQRFKAQLKKSPEAQQLQQQKRLFHQKWFQPKKKVPQQQHGQARASGQWHVQQDPRHQYQAGSRSRSPSSSSQQSQASSRGRSPGQQQQQGQARASGQRQVQQDPRHQYQAGCRSRSPSSSSQQSQASSRGRSPGQQQQQGQARASGQRQVQQDPWQQFQAGSQQQQSPNPQQRGSRSPSPKGQARRLDSIYRGSPAAFQPPQPRSGGPQREYKSR